ncbi:ribosome recycling factor [Candidatus Dojkabacteria bacterium]|nr:ribosome recycling factor [Candidatus Dojkabacteria bacterium]
MSRTKLSDFKEKAATAIKVLKDNLLKIRSGRAHPSMVEDIKVEAYGEQQPMKNVATINIPDPQQITIQPWDKSLLDSIVQAVQEANIGINPVPHSDMVRLPLPQLTEERREEYVKMMKEEVEQAKIVIRNLRKDVLVGINNEKDEGEISEDEYARLQKELQKQVDEANDLIDEMAEKKEKELMTV